MRVLSIALRVSLSVALSVAMTGFGWAQSVPASTVVPQGGRVSAGAAAIQQGGTATNPVLTINQSSDRAVINWQSFDLGRDASVQFVQPSASSVTLNRVISSDPSSIFGKISSNGQIYLINPNGIYFGPTASADVGGLVATTHGMRGDDFMAGSTTFTRDGATGKVANEGMLRAHMGGYIALLAPEVRNAGIIVAKSGTVALAAGDAVTLNVDANNSLTNLLVKPSTMQALVDNQKIVKAPDGQVIVSAQAYNEIAAGVINNSGEISAKGISKSGGSIVLGASSVVNQTGKLNVSSKAGNGGTVKIDAKTVTQSGTIKADSTAVNGKGGAVTLTGDTVALKTGSTISADGTNGGGTVLVGGDWQGSNGVRQAQSVVMEQGASITANATQTGDGGKVVLWSDVTNQNGFTKFDGVIEAKGFAGGKGGRVETSGHVIDVSKGQIDATSGGGENGLWLLDPYNVTIQSTGTAISGDFTSSTTSYITAASVAALLNTGTNVTISTGATGSPGADAGLISITSAINKTAGASATLTLIAANSISSTVGISSTSNALNLVLDTSTGSGTLSGVLALGAGTLTKQGAGTITLSVGNSYTGDTIINGGKLIATQATSMGPTGAGTVIINNGGTLDIQTVLSTKPLVLNAGGMIASSSGAASSASNLVLQSDTTFNITGTSLILSGVISGSGYNITKTGTGILSLTGANTFTGNVYVNAGTLTAGAATVFDGSGNVVSSGLGAGNNVVLGGGTLSVNLATTVNSFSATSGTLSLTSDLTFGGDNSSTSFVGGMNGAGKLIKNGTGTFINGNSSSFNVGYVINNGIMKLNHANAGAYENITIGANGTLDLNGFNASASTYTTHLQGSGFNGQGALINSSATTSTFNAGNLYWDSMSDFLINTANGQITLTSTLEKSGSTPTIVKTGAGVLNTVGLSGTASFIPSAFNILQGTATIGTAYTTGSHLLNISVASGATAAISLAGTQTYSGVISGAGNVSFVNGTTTVSGSNTYTGTTTISGATVSPSYTAHYTNGVIDYSPFGISNSVIMANAANSNLNIGTIPTELYSLSGGGTSGGNVNLGTTTLTVGAGNTNTTFAGIIAAGSYTGSLIKVGTGTLTLSGSSTFTGPTTINAGVLAAASAGAMGTVSATASQSMITVNSGATFDLQVGMTSTKPVTLNGGTFQNSGATGVTYSGAISLTADSIVNTTGNYLSFTGVISNTGGNFGFTKNGSKGLYLSGTNTFGGNVTINNGTLFMSSAAAFGAVTNTVTVNTGGFLDVQTTGNAYPLVMNGGGIGNSSVTSSTYSGAVTLQADTPISLTNSGNLSFTGAIGGTYGVTITGTSTGGVNFWANNSYSGITTVSSGTVSLGSGTVPTGDFGATSQIVDNGKIYIYRQNSVTLNAPISGTGGIYIGGTGSQLTLTGTSTFAGSINLPGASAKLTLSSTASLSPGVTVNVTATSGSPTIDLSALTSPVTFASLSGTGNASASLLLGSGGLTIAGGTTTFFGQISGSAPLTINGNVSLTQVQAVANTVPITIGNTGTLNVGYYIGGSNSIYTNLITNNGTFRFSGAASSQTLTGGMTGSGNVIRDTGNPALTLQGSLTYTGTTTVTAGTLAIGDATAVGAAATIPTGDFITSGTGRLVIGTTSASDTISSNISGSGSFQKWGPGSLSLNGTNTYTGTTTVSNGTLKFGSSVPTGTIVVANTTQTASFDLNGMTYSNNFSATNSTNSLVTAVNIQNSSSTPAVINGNLDLIRGIMGGGNLTIGGTGDIIINGLITNSSTTNGAGIFNKVGTGTLTLNTASPRLGPTDQISAGTVALGSAGSLGASFVGLTMTGGSLTYNDQNLVFAGPFNLSGAPSIIGTGNATLSVTNTSTATMAGTITTTGAQSYSSNPSTLAGSLTLNTTNANVTMYYMTVATGGNGLYDFALNLGTGNLLLTSTNWGIAASGNVPKTIKMNGTGSFTASGGTSYATNDIYINGSYTGPALTSTNGPVTVTGTASAKNSTSSLIITGGSAGPVTMGDVSNVAGFTINTTNNNSVMTGTISGSTGNFYFNTATGYTTGTLTFSGNNSSNLPLALAGGKFVLGSSQFGTGTITEYISNPTLDLNGQTLSNSLTLFGTGVGGIGALINSNTTTTATMNGAVTVGLSSTNFGGVGNTVINGIISGGQMAYNLTKIGTGSVTLNGVNTFGHTLQISAGTVIATNASSLNTSTTSMSVSAGATLDLQNVVMSASRTLSLAGTLIASTGNSSYAGPVGFGANAVIDAGSGATLTLSSVSTTSTAYSKGTGAGTVSLYLNNSTISGAFTNNGGTTIFTGNSANYTGAFTINSGTVQVGTGAVIGGASNIVDNGNLIFNRSGTALSGMMGNVSITGTGNVTVIAASSALNIDRTITLTGANSTITIEADASAAAGATLTSDLTLTNMLTTSATGTITIFAGSPNPATLPISTAALSSKMTGATGAIQYKNYYSAVSALSGAVSGTRNFYYRSRPSLTITGGSLLDNKVYDGTLSVAATPTPGTTTGAVDGDTMGAVFQSATYQTASAGVNKPITATFNIASTNPAWVVTGYSSTVTGGSYQGTITPAPLTITALAQSTTYGQTLALGNSLYTASGLVNNETITSVALYYGNSGTVATVPTGVNAATYAGAIRAASPSGVGFTASNYAITYNNGTLTVNPATLTAPLMTVASRAYDGSLVVVPTVGALSGLAGSETLSVTAAGLIDNANVGTRTATVTYTLANGTNGGLASNYRLNGVTQSVLINPRPITVATSATDRPYDGTTTIATALGTVSNLVGSETLNISSAAVSDSPNAGARTATVTYSLADGSNGGLASNYSITTLALPVTIQQRVLTIAGTTVSDRSYDGSQTVAVTPGVAIGNLVGSETVQIAAAGSITGKDVGVYTATATYTLSDGSNGGLAGNYSLPATTHANVTISPKALSVTGTAVTDRVYDGTTNVAATLGAVTGLVGTETLNISTTGTAASADAGSRATTVAYTLANGTNGGLAGNYSLASTAHTVTITPADVVLTGTRPYDQTSVVDGGILTATGLNGDTFLVTGAGHTSNLNSVNAGTYPLATLTGLSLGANNGQGNPANYQLSTTGSSIIITKIPITLTGDLTGTVQKTYDGNTSLPVTGTAPYAVAGGLLAGDSVSFSGSAAFDNANAGTRTITQGTLVVTGPSAGNYSLNWTNGAGVINKAPLDITANNAAGFYGQSPTLSVSYSGFVNGENAISANVTSSVVRNTNTNVLTPSMTADNYYTRTATSGLYTLVAADKMLITLNNATKVYGPDYAMPGFTALSASYSAVDPNNPANTIIMPVAITSTTNNTYSFNDGAGGLGSFQISTAALLSSRIGNYAITVAPANFSVIGTPHFNAMQVQDGVLTITPRPIAVQAGGVSKIYDGNAAITAFTVAPTGLIAGDVVTASAVSGVYADKNTGSSKSYTLTGLSLGGSDAANYYLAAGATYTGGNGEITQKSVSVSGITAASKIYDGTTAAVVAVNGAIINGLVAGDTVSVAATGAFDTKNAGVGKTVNLTSTYTGTDAGNYSFTSQATTTADVTPKALTMTGTTVADKAYDGTLAASATQGVLTGFVVGEQVTSTVASANFGNKNVGNQTATVAYQLANGSNGLASNYSLVDTSLTAAITQREVGLSAARTYDGTTALGAGTVAITTGVAGEALNYSLLTATAATKNVGAGNYVSALTLLDGSGGLASNYKLPDMTVAGVKNNASFTTATLTITGMVADAKIYDGTTAVNLRNGSLSGILLTDQVNLIQTGAFNSKDVGSAVAVTSTSTMSGTDAQNYSLIQPTTITAAITQKDIVVSGLTIANSKIYDGTTNATITATGFVTTQSTGTGTTSDRNLYNVDAVVLSGTPQAYYNSKDVVSANLATVSGYSLTGTGAGNYNLIAPTQAASITPKNVSIAGLTITASKVYDATTTAAITGTATLLSQNTGSGHSTDGKIYTVDPLVTLTGTATAAYDNKDVLTASSIAVTGLTLNGAGSSNYTLLPLSQSGTITPKNLTMTGLTLVSSSKIYDGTTTAPLQNATGSLQSSIAAGTGTSGDGVPYTGDAVTLSGTAAANYTTKNAGTGLTIVFSGVGLSGAEAGNYTLTQQAALSNGSITPKSLSVANTVVADKIYDTTTMASLSSGSLVGLVAGDASGVVLNQAGAFVDANAGLGKTVVASDSISGASAGNYSLTQPTGLTATISQKTVTITGMQAADKIYDGTAAAVLSGGSLSGVFTGDQAQVALSQAGAFASTNVGSNIGVTSTSNLSGAQSGNYNLIQPTGITASITTKDLTVSGTSVATKTYDATTAASLSGGALVGLVPSDTSTILATPAGRFLDANAGTGKPVTPVYTLSGVLASNYRLIQPAGLTGTIDKATLTVTPSAGLAKVYGGFDPVFTYGLAGYVGGETTAAGLSGLVTRAAGENVATYAYNVGQLSANNYQFTLAGGAPTFAITPATLIVKANTDAKFVTQPDAVNFNSASYNGFVNGETPSVLSGALAVTRTNSGQNNAGTYAGVLQPAGLSSNNYTIQYQAGDYVIVPAGQLLIRAANTTTPYGTNPALGAVSVKYMQDNNGTAELMTLVQSPSNASLYSDGVGGSVTFNLTAPGPLSSSGTLNVGQYAMTATGVVKQGNNFLNDPVVIGTLSVVQKSLTPQAAPSKAYDGTTVMPAANLTLAGLLAGDQVTSASSGVYQSRNAGNSVGYHIYDVAISGSDSANYYLANTTFSANNGVIIPKAVTLAPQAVSKTYDGSAVIASTNADLNVLTTQLGVAGDMVTGVTLTYDTKNAGANKSLAASNAVIADGNNGLNYAISYQNNTASQIGQATLTVAGSTVSTKAYDGTTAAVVTGGTLVGVVGADQVVLAQSGLFANANAASSITVTATDSLAGSAANNYSLVQPTGLTGTILPKTLSVSGTVVADKIYSGTTDATISTLGAIQGLVGAETLALNGLATFSNANAGANKSVALDYTLSNGSGLASNYNLPAATATATINRASLVVKANNDARFIAQGDAFNYNGVNYTGFVNGETAAVLGGNLVVSRSNPAQNSAATYNGVLVPAGLTSNNYSIAYQAGNYTIVPADQVLVRMDNVMQNYGTALSLAPQSVQYFSSGNVLTTLTQSSSSNNSYTYNDGLGGGLSFTLTPANPVTSTSGTLVVGNYAVTGSGISASGNNFIGTPVFVGDISIQKSALTPSTNQVSKTYNGSAAMGTVSVQFAGVVTQGGTSDAVTSTGAGVYATKNAGTNISYSVTGLALTGADAANYYIAGGSAFSGSNGVIIPKAVSLVAGASQKIYDGTTSVAATPADLAALTTQLGVTGDKVDAVTLQYGDRNAGTGKMLTPSGSVISDGQGGQNYQITYVSSFASIISPKAVTLTPQTASKTYDASTSYTANNSDLVYLSAQLGVAGDTVTGISLLAPDKTIGTKTLAASAALINDGNSGLNYIPTYGSSSVAVAAKNISTLNTAVVSKTYDKNTTATLSGGVLNGVEIGDTVSLAQTGIFATTQAGTNIAVAAIESISGLDAGNYILLPTLGLAGTINQRALTVTYGGINKVYDTSTLAQVTTSDNRIAGDNLIINRTAAFTSANVGANVNVQLSGVYLTGGDALNYSVAATGTATATITQRPVLVTGSTVDTKVYDGNTNATLSNGVVVGFLGSDHATLNQSGNFATPNAGTNIAVTAQDTLSGAGAGNYIVEQPIGLTGTILTKTLSVSGSAVTNRIYDGTTAIASTAGTLSGFVGSETVTATSVATASSKNVGTQTATLVYALANGTNGGLAGNYSLASTTLPVSITVKDLSVIGTKIETKIFDGKTDAKASGGVLVGVVGGDQITLVENATFTSSNVGLSVPVIMNDQILGAFVGNYRLLQPQGLTGTINANTPILYPSVSNNNAVNPAPSPAAGGASGGWTIETSASPAPASQAGASPPAASLQAGTNVTIKVVAETGALQNVPDFLNVGRVVTLDGGVGNPSIASASINFVKGFEPGRTILELNQLGPVQVRIDNESGKIVLSGAASVAEYNRIIQSVRLKLNGASQQRIVAMNIGLVDMTGKRDTRMITLKPNDVANSAEIRVPMPSPAQPIVNQALKPVNEQQGRIMVPALPAAPIQYPQAAPRRQTTSLEMKPQLLPVGFEVSSGFSANRNQFIATSSNP